MSDVSAAIGGLGHNNPPISIIETLAAKYKRDLDKGAELRDAAKTVPERIDDDITEAKVTELILSMRGIERVLEDAQKAERKPFNEEVKKINGFFLTKIEPIEADRNDLSERSTAYLQRKAAAEKRAAEEEAERKREQARKDLEAAEKAQNECIAAENARKEEERKAEEARKAREKAEQDRKDAEARKEAAIEEEKRLAKARKEREEREAIEAKEKKERDEAEDARRAAQKLIDDAAAAKAKAEREQAEKEEAEAKVKRDAARKEQREAEDAAAQAQREVRTATREGKQAMDDALRGEKHADKLDAKAEGPDADLARTRSEHGGLGTLGRAWTYQIVDINKLDKIALWNLIDAEAIRVAVGKWMNLQPPTQEARKMPGAVFEIETSAIHR